MGWPAWRAAISAAETTSTVAATSDVFAGVAVAVTVIESANGAVLWAEAAATPPRSAAKTTREGRMADVLSRKSMLRRKGTWRRAGACCEAGRNRSPHPGGRRHRTSGRSPGSRIFLLPDLPARPTELRSLARSGVSGFVPGYSGGGRAGFLPASLLRAPRSSAGPPLRLGCQRELRTARSLAAGNLARVYCCGGACRTTGASCGTALMPVIQTGRPEVCPGSTNCC